VLKATVITASAKQMKTAPASIFARKKIRVKIFFKINYPADGAAEENYSILLLYFPKNNLKCQL
jgi:hypothetical protein